VLREVFDTLMRAFIDEDRSTFLRHTSQEFSSNLDDLRDYNELETSIQERFSCCSINVYYTIQEVQAQRESGGQGSVDFYWRTSSGSGTNNLATFKFQYTEGEWKLTEVIDDNTFLRASRIAYSIELTLEKTRVTADGSETCEVTATVLDRAGSIVADGLEVHFSADKGSILPAVEHTSSGVARSTYTAPTTDGEATITATSVIASQSEVLILDPVTPPPPPPD
jgi:hypothetical protein